MYEDHLRFHQYILKNSSNIIKDFLIDELYIYRQKDVFMPKLPSYSPYNLNTPALYGVQKSASSPVFKELFFFK